jgi:hypothetical protein
MERMPETRKQALDMGVTYYYTGKPCIRGHYAPRFTSNKACKICADRRNIERTRHGFWKNFGDEEYREKKRQYAIAYYRQNKQKWKRRSLLRRRLIKKSTIMSPEKERLAKLLYLEAQRLTLETGIEYVVDHIVPLKHRLVCGLHTYANLQCITAEQNRVKGNTFYIEDD